MDTRDREIADYTTLGLCIGLPWETARAAAKAIVIDHEQAEATS